MIELLISDRNGALHSVEGTSSLSLMENIRDAGIDELLALCGGCCSCGTCHVYIDPDWIEVVGEASGDESDLLDGSSHRSRWSRLACQVQVAPALSGLRATIAPED